MEIGWCDTPQVELHLLSEEKKSKYTSLAKVRGRSLGSHSPGVLAKEDIVWIKHWRMNNDTERNVGSYALKLLENMYHWKYKLKQRNLNQLPNGGCTMYIYYHVQTFWNFNEFIYSNAKYPLLPRLSVMLSGLLGLFSSSNLPPD